MRKIVPISDLQRQAGQVLASMATNDDPVMITQRGRAAAVLVSARRYAEIEEDLARLDELELVEMVAQGREAKRMNDTLTQTEVKQHLNQLHQTNDASQPAKPVKRAAAKKRSGAKKR